MKRHVPTLLALLLAACAPPHNWDGELTARKVQAVQSFAEVWVAAPTGANPRPAPPPTVRQAVQTAATQGTVSAAVLAPTAAAAGALRSMLTGLGVTPTRIDTRVTANLPAGQALVQVRSARAVAPECGLAREPMQISGFAMEEPEYRMGCATAANFAAMLANPEDLVTDPALSLERGRKPAEAVERSLARWNTVSSDSSSSSGSNSDSGQTGGNTGVSQ